MSYFGISCSTVCVLVQLHFICVTLCVYVCSCVQTSETTLKIRDFFVLNLEINKVFCLKKKKKEKKNFDLILKYS